MRHETRVWLVPGLIAVVLAAGWYLTPEPTPSEPPAPVAPLPTSARDSYFTWLVLSFALPGPMRPGLHPVLLLPERLVQGLDTLNARRDR
ncbi:MAG: hypothetical protein ACYTEG_06120 [Planctomycetota bacterium]|jgi:hypothetical protein